MAKNTMKPLEIIPNLSEDPVVAPFFPPNWIPITVNPDQLRRVLKKLLLGTNGIFREGFLKTFDARFIDQKHVPSDSSDDFVEIETSRGKHSMQLVLIPALW